MEKFANTTLPAPSHINPFAAEHNDAEIVTAQQKAQTFWTQGGSRWIIQMDLYKPAIDRWQMLVR